MNKNVAICQLSHFIVVNNLLLPPFFPSILFQFLLENVIHMNVNLDSRNTSLILPLTASNFSHFSNATVSRIIHNCTFHSLSLSFSSRFMKKYAFFFQYVSVNLNIVFMLDERTIACKLHKILIINKFWTSYTPNSKAVVGLFLCYVEQKS